MPFQHTAIVGLGLLGGSLALDLRAHVPEMRITGIARREATRVEAQGLAIDGRPVFTALAAELDAAREADLIVLCTPVQTIIAQLAVLATIAAPGTVITDVGSTKRTVMNAAATVLPQGTFFIGGHPMAGSEKTGLSQARRDLYRGATWALCVPPGAEEAAARLAALVTTLGARPLTLDADSHDALVALTSHLPHVLAAALANVTLGSTYDDLVLPFIAGGFRDGTRVAAGSPEMWRDILLTNRDQALRALQALQTELEGWRVAIQGGDAALLEALLTAAKVRRDHVPSPAVALASDE
jgi:prephenate dehydrogenase